MSVGAPMPTIWSMAIADDGELDSDLGLGEQSDERELAEWELGAEWERARTEALHQLCEGLARLRGEAPPKPAIRAAAVKLRANLGSEAYPFPQLARALARSSGQPLVEDVELLIGAVAATVAPLPESQEQELADGGDQAEGAEDEGAEADLPLEMDTEELELEDCWRSSSLPRGRGRLHGWTPNAWSWSQAWIRTRTMGGSRKERSFGRFPSGRTWACWTVAG